MDLNKLEEITQQDIETYHKYKQVGMMLGASFIELVPSSILLEENRYDSLGRILPNRSTILDTSSGNLITLIYFFVALSRCRR